MERTRIIDTRIDHIDRNHFQGSVTWSDGVRFDGARFTSYGEADQWLCEVLNSSEPDRTTPMPHRSRACPTPPSLYRRAACAALAIALLLPVTLPAMAHRGSGRIDTPPQPQVEAFTPVDNGGLRTPSGSSGTR